MFHETNLSISISFIKLRASPTVLRKILPKTGMDVGWYRNKSI
jgi:hypothetical protein